MSPKQNFDHKGGNGQRPQTAWLMCRNAHPEGGRSRNVYCEIRSKKPGPSAPLAKKAEQHRRRLPLATYEAGGETLTAR
jgi:hypothetical protein